MKLMSFFSLVALAIFFGFCGAYFSTATNPALSNICIFLCGAIGVWLLLDALDQIMNSRKKLREFYSPEADEEVRLIYITEHPNRFSEEQVRQAHLRLDELYYNRINIVGRPNLYSSIRDQSFKGNDVYITPAKED